MSDMQHGTVNGYGNRGCRCAPCREVASEYRKRFAKNETPEEHAAAVNRYQATNRTGLRSGRQWTAPELEFIAARDQRGKYLRSAKDAALALDRSVLAVERARHKCRRDPRFRALLGASDA